MMDPEMGMMAWAMMATGALVWALYAVIVVVPFWRLLPAHGWPRELSLIAVFPPLALLLLWFVAFGDLIPRRP
jgi:hypothetical protein